jgi:2'-5' RNA ligase
MAFNLELRFGAASEAFVKHLMQRLKDVGLPSNLLEKSVSPHLTLLSSETKLAESTLEKLDKRLKDQETFSLGAVSLSTFANEQGVLFLGVSVPRTLLDFHVSIHEQVDQNAYQLRPLYLPDRWVPHVTLATQFSKVQLAQAVERLELTLPVKLEVSRLAYVKYPAPLELLKAWSFTNRVAS